MRQSALVSSALLLVPNGEKKAWNLKKRFLGLDLPARPVVISDGEAKGMPGLGADIAERPAPEQAGHNPQLWHPPSNLVVTAILPWTESHWV
jgi:hypothetical protein